MKLINGRLDHPEVRIENTSRCNARCITCPREKMTRRKEDMDLNLFKRLVDEAYSLGAQMVSTFGYGEPLLDEHIVERIKYCSDIGLATFITTNASLLDVSMTRKLIEAGLTNIRFSVNGITEREFESFERGLKQKDVIRNICNFLTINRMDADVTTYINSICLSGDVEYTRMALEAQFKTDYLEIWRPHNWAGGRNFRQPSTNERVKCYRAFTGPVQILADGRMILCCFDYNGELSIGSTNVHSIKKILEDSTELRRYRRLHDTGNLAGLPCEKCDQRFVYTESPLLYSNEQEDKSLHKTSITKVSLVKEETNGLCKTEQKSDCCSGC